MSEQDDNEQAGEVPTGEPVAAPVRARRYRKRRFFADVALVFFAISLGIFAGLYVTRERLAGDLIDSTLAEYGVPARYEVISIGPQQQVIGNIVVGDPLDPDLTVERAVVTIAYRFGTPAIGGIRLEKPRLYGRWDGEKVSFGALDSVIYDSASDEPFALPDLDIAIADGRAMVRSPWGDVGAKLEGTGNLASGFAGVAGAVMPRMALGDCTGEGGSLYGKLATRRGRLAFDGPVRLASLQCASGAAMGQNALQLHAETPDFASFALRGRLNGRGLAHDMAHADALTGDLALTRDGKGALVSNFDLSAGGVEASGIKGRTVRLEGRVRARPDLSHVAFNGGLEGEGLQAAGDLNTLMAGWRKSAAGTLAEPLLAKLQSGLAAEGKGSSFSADMQARLADGRMTLIVPQARWRGTSGETLLALSRGQYGFGGDRPVEVAGNFSTGGAGLPRITGRMEEREDGVRAMRLTMAEYGARDASLTVPDMRIVQNASGAVSITGRLVASGAFPGGRIEALNLPVAGGWSERSGLALGTACISPRFDALTLASLSMVRQSITLCPPGDGAMLRVTQNGARFAAGVPELALAGRLGDTPVRVNGGPVGFAFPGTMAARDLDVQLGEGGSATQFVLSDLKADLGSAIGGSFADAEMRMAAVPHDITRASGQWSYYDGVLALDNVSLRMTDRAASARFNPMVSDGATLRLADNRIAAQALLREETTGRQVTAVDIAHDLGSGTGHADLAVDGLRFDDGLQPTDITPLALGVVANMQGRVDGSGRIDWNAQGITSTGQFTTASLDFAAAFGPVNGMAGTIRFTDLMGMVTAPDQTITVAEINPGIPVENGVIRYALEEGNVFAFHSGKWPFVGGTLELRPVRMTLGADETRRYVFVIEGLDAARFLERMEMANLSATGTFDGTLPVVFDKAGGRVEEGFLQSRAPGGNLSYVGALSYEDMSAITNFAFDALKSLDYKNMTIGMDGALEGEIVTRVRIDGVSQGEAASKNILTRKLASLPVRFNVNIRAPFYQLLSSLKSLYDPASVRDPRELGLLKEEGGALVPDPEAPEIPPAPQSDLVAGLPPVKPSIHNAESETVP